MNPKSEIFFDAITLLPEELVEEAQDYRFRKKPAVWKKLGSLAACVVLIMSLSLLALPRGCGGSAPEASQNSSGVSTDVDLEGGAPTNVEGCAPGDAPSGDTAPPYGGIPPQEPGAPPEEPADGDHGSAEAFTGLVVEIRASAILVEPLEGEAERSTADRILVSVDGLTLPELAAGDKIRVTYTGGIQESYPAGITGTLSVERAEEG